MKYKTKDTLGYIIFLLMAVGSFLLISMWITGMI